jgi:hypothetical protein
MTTWPARPTCHDSDYRVQAPFRFGAPEWRPAVDSDARAAPGRESYRPFRVCSFCGSMHPEDLVAALKAGARLSGSDWKNGWPHKFYVHDIPHSHPDREVYKGGRSGPKYRCVTCGFEPDPVTFPPKLCEHVRSSRDYEVIGHYSHNDFGPVGLVLQGKWYNDHLADLSMEAFAELAHLLKERAGIEWSRGADGRIGYRAPCAGYQR